MALRKAIAGLDHLRDQIRPGVEDAEHLRVKVQVLRIRPRRKGITGMGHISEGWAIDLTDPPVKSWNFLGSADSIQISQKILCDSLKKLYYLYILSTLEEGGLQPGTLPWSEFLSVGGSWRKGVAGSRVV